MKLITSWDDGSIYDLKLAELLDRYQIQGIFYVPIENSLGRAVMSVSDLRQISQKFEIGGHTFHHVHLTRIPPSEAQEEIYNCKKKLEDIIGRTIDSFCFPFGDFNDEIMGMVKKSGFKHARNVRLLNCHESEKLNFLQEPNIHFYPHSCCIDLLHCLKKRDFFTFFRRLHSFNTPHITIYKNCNSFSGDTLHVWGHGWEIEELGLWEDLEDLLRFFSENQNIR